MSFGFGFGLPSWQTLSGGFSPASLFSGGEQGVWYEPSPSNGTLFQDAAGTTPVTAVEQFVGLMLDKSKGLVLGSELSNPATQTFGTATGTQSGAGWNVTATGAFAQLLQTGVLTAGRWYKVRFKWSGNTNGRTIRFLVGGTAATYAAGTGASGDVTFYITASTNTSAYFQINDSVNGDTFYLEINSVRELPGNHATSTGTKRPKLAARYNLLTYTEDLSNGVWAKFQSTVTSNAAVAPNGTTTADKLIPNNGATSGFTYNTASPAIPVGTGATASVWVKAAELGFAWVVCNVRASSSTTGVCVNLSTGALTNGGANGTYAVADAGNGWWRVECTATASSANSYIEVWPLAAAGVNGTYTGNGTSGIYIWGADLRPASQATGLIGPTYQRVVDAATYDTAGFLPYLQFDGIDDSMSTGSIDFTATDKMTVWAGVRKNLDQFLILSEFSADLTSNNGTFGIYPGAPNFGAFGANGTTFRQASSANGAWGTPATVVLCGQADIAQPVTAIRVNGTQSNNTASLGTGNFGNYSLFIGARNNASLFFNGWLTSLIVRGAQSTQSQIEATEAWVNQRTGAF